MLQLSFPSPSDLQKECVWNGRAFIVDGREQSVLAYDSMTSGWTDELTSFHEAVAGDTHYIDIASRNHALATLNKWVQSKAPVIIDIGCSSGSMLRLMRERLPHATLIGADYISGPLRGLAASLPGIPFLQFNLVSCPLPSSSVDAVVLLNVLEHIEDDRAAMEQVFRILKPGGVAVIEVPAGPHLFDVYDKQLMHFRRYTLRSLCDKLAETHFIVKERSHLGVFLYPAFAIVKKRNKRYMYCSDERQREIVARNVSQSSNSPLMNAIMRVEEGLRPYLHYPIGIRCLAVGTKPV